MANSKVREFVNQIAPLIVAEAKKRGYAVCSTVIAQAIIESRYGESTLSAKYHNYFGLKCGSAWLKAGKPSISLKTKEEYRVGQLTTISDYFRVYPDMKSGVAGYYDFIATSRYANLKTARTYIEYAQYLKADGYATSSTYVNTLCNTVLQNGLEIYDTGYAGVLPGTQEAVASQWQVGKVYTTTSDLYIRKEPNGSKVKWSDITPNARDHSKREMLTGNAILKKGTRVTCKGITIMNGVMWMQIPSGYICARNSKAVYIV